jgi:hypothetical protein
MFSSHCGRATIKLTENRRAFVTFSYFLLAIPQVFAKLPPASVPDTTLNNTSLNLIMLARKFFQTDFPQWFART